MNICFLTESFYPEINGGAVHTRQLAKCFHDADNNVLIITRRALAKYPKKELVSGYPVIRVGPDDRFGMIGRYLGVFTILKPLFKHRADYDAVVVSAPRIIGAPVVVLMKLIGKKCVIKPDSCGEMNGSYALDQLANRPVVRFLANTYFQLRNLLLKRADSYISISSVVSAELHGIGIAESRIAEIPNGVDTHQFSPAGTEEKQSLRRQHGLTDSSIVFAYSGRLTYEKGLISLIQVWKQLADRYQNLHLFLIGTGEGMSLDCEGELRLFVQEHGLEKTVTFTGAVEDVRPYLQCADIFVLPSKTEALGVALIESQLVGIPAIATRVGGIPDVIAHEKNGLLVAPDSNEELFAATLELIENKAKRTEMGSAAREISVEKFSLEKISQRYMTLVDSLIHDGTHLREQ